MLGPHEQYTLLNQGKIFLSVLHLCDKIVNSPCIVYDSHIHNNKVLKILLEPNIIADTESLAMACIDNLI